MGSEHKLLKFSDAYINGNAIWFGNRTLKGLFRAELDTGNAEYIAETGDVLKILRFSHNLFLFSHFDFKVWIYRLGDNGVEAIDYESTAVPTLEIIDCGGTALIIPLSLKRPFVSLDFKEKRYINRAAINKKIAAAAGDKKDISFSGCCRTENALWLVLADDTRVVEYRLDTEEAVLHVVPVRDTLSLIAHDGKDIWLSFRNQNSLIRWHPGGCSTEWYLPESQNRSLSPTASFPYSKIIVTDDCILAIPSLSNQIVTVDQKSHVLRMMEYPAGFHARSNKGEGESLLYGYRIMDQTLFLFPWGGNQLIIVDQKNRETRGLSIKMEECEATNQYLESFITQDIILEDKPLSLEEFCDCVAPGSHKSNGSCRGASSCGALIWKNVKSSICETSYS